ncbi:response regulator transcription factor [Salinimonas chungwhensis]|uniref:response regulator transcription factor n=1 Tax=Salinimonas chungwhensis TaxID=265425 RepID=UPI00036B9706|nr:response regulator [Salinimonas chungwhensis]
MKLLIIDDDARLTEVLARRFTNVTHYEVNTFGTASEAMKADPNNVDAILLDMMLDNDEVGLSFVEALAARFTPTHLIIMTGYASIATTVAAIKKGATDYIAKPVGFQELLTRLNIDAAPPTATLLPMTPAQVEWEHIQRVLHANDGNISATAKTLGMHRRTLQRKLQKFSPSKQ